MDTIKSKSTIVKLEDGRSFKVRRMRWKDSRKWLRSLGSQASEMLSLSGLMGDTGDKISLVTLVNCATQIIEQSDNLITDLLSASIRELTPEVLDELDTMEASALIAAAIDVNLDEDLKNCWTGVMNRVAMILSSAKPKIPTKPSSPSMPVLYEQDIQPNT